MLRWSAVERGVKRFIAETEKLNVRSGTVLQKMGFEATEVGLLTHHFRLSSVTESPLKPADQLLEGAKPALLGQARRWKGELSVAGWGSGVDRSQAGCR